jgi:hypothetical protein
MQLALLDGMGASADGPQLTRVDIDFMLPASLPCSPSTILGRKAHIEFLVSDAYMRLLVWGVLIKQGLVEIASGAWV